MGNRQTPPHPSNDNAMSIRYTYTNRDTGHQAEIWYDRFWKAWRVKPLDPLPQLTPPFCDCKREAIDFAREITAERVTVLEAAE